MDDIHKSLFNGEVRREAAFVHTYVFAHKVKGRTVVATNCAPVHEGPRVCLQVALDGGTPSEELVAHFALIGLLPCMDPPVIVEFTGMGKPFPAYLAAVFTVPRLVLESHVLTQELLWQFPLLRRLLVETVSETGPNKVQAVAALVLAYMVAVSSFQLKSLATIVTSEQGFLHALVYCHVLLQEVPVHKTVRTNRARKNRDAQVGERVPHKAAEV